MNLRLSEVAKLANSCKSFNALCPLKLEGDVALARARSRQMLTDERALRELQPQLLQRLLRSMAVLRPR